MSMHGLPRPNTLLPLDEPHSVPGSNGKSYKVTRKSTHYHCTCPAWTFQKAVPIELRTCKHLRQLLGDHHEDARCGPSTVKQPKTKTPKKQPATSASSSKAGSSSSTPAPPASKKVAAAAKRELSPAAPPAPASKKQKQTEPAQAAAEEPPASSASLSDLSLEDGEVADKEVGLLLAHKFDLDSRKRDPTGWWMSEKLDGVRAYWDGQGSVFSRVGKKFYPPKSFTDKLPQGLTLDGELWSTRDSFDVTSGIVRSQAGQGWDAIKFMAFDTPSLGQLPFEERMKNLHELFPDKVRTQAEADAAGADAGEEVPVGVVEVVAQTKCKGWDHLLDELKAVQAQDGEGLMLRQAESVYVGKRSTTLLKVKTFYDAEARVTGYEPGKGRLEGMTGALLCEMANGNKFSVGSGLDDARRSNPPKIGAIVNYRFQELTKAGIPRFPTFVGERFDATGPKDAKVRPKAIVAAKA